MRDSIPHFLFTGCTHGLESIDISGVEGLVALFSVQQEKLEPLYWLVIQSSPNICGLEMNSVSYNRGCHVFVNVLHV